MSVCVTDLGHRRQLSGYPQLVIQIHSVSQYGHHLLHLDHWGREGGREGGMEGGRKGGREGGRERGREGRRDGGREGRRDGGREGGRERVHEGS